MMNRPHPEISPLRPWRASVFLLTVTLVFTSGCNTSYVVTPSLAREGYSYTRFNADLAEKNGIVELLDGTEVQASKIRITADSLSWSESVSGNVGNAKTWQVKRVTRTSRIAGAIAGFGLGILGGGVYFGATLLHPGQEFVNANEAIPRLPWFPALGAVIGAVVSHQVEYRFQSDSTNSTPRPR